MLISCASEGVTHPPKKLVMPLIAICVAEKCCLQSSGEFMENVHRQKKCITIGALYDI